MDRMRYELKKIITTATVLIVFLCALSGCGRISYTTISETDETEKVEILSDAQCINYTSPALDI